MAKPKQPATLDALNREYEAYIKRLRASWLAQNPPRVARDIFGVQRDVYEVMDERDRAAVHACIAEWGRYITPIAEAWWKERGYGVVWPDDNSKPMQVYKLESTRPPA